MNYEKLSHAELVDRAGKLRDMKHRTASTVEAKLVDRRLRGSGRVMSGGNVRKVQNLRRSGAAGAHGDRRTKRNRTRADQLRAAIEGENVSDNVIFGVSSPSNISFRILDDSGISKSEWSEMTQREKDVALTDWLFTFGVIEVWVEEE